MNIPVEYRLASGRIENKTFTMTRLAFAKHMALAGQGYHITPRNILKVIGMYFHYSYYMQPRAMAQNRFSEPPMHLSDPTEKGQFSTIVGRAVGDFLSKRIGGALYTVNYEAAMRVQGYKVKGPRPDLISYGEDQMFALEAKGKDSHNAGNMADHKRQAAAGPLTVHYSVASVTYRLYDSIQCKYHDPVNPNTRYDNASLQTLTRIYYRGFEEFLAGRLFGYSQFSVQREQFYKVELFPASDGIRGRFKWPLGLFQEMPFLPKYKLHLVIPANIDTMASEGITNASTPFIYQQRDEDPNMFIDNDRIGLLLE